MPNQEQAVTAGAESPAEQLLAAQAQMQAQMKQQRFMRHLSMRPVPAFWQPVIKYLLVLDEYAPVREQEELAHMNDEQIFHGVVTGNISLFNANISKIGGRLHSDTVVHVKSPYNRYRAPIQQMVIPKRKKTDEQVFAEAHDTMMLETQRVQNQLRFNPLTKLAGVVGPWGKLNPELYFRGLGLIAQADAAKAQEIAERHAQLPEIATAFENDTAELALREDQLELGQADERLIKQEPSPEQEVEVEEKDLPTDSPK